MDIQNVAAQMYTLRAFTRTPEDISTTLKKVKEMGFDTIQISGFCPCDPVYIKELLDQNQLKVCATHMPFQRFIDEIDDIIHQHQLWDCPYIGLGSMPDRFRQNRDTVVDFMRQILPAAEKIAEAGMKFVYHNHRFEFTKEDGKIFYEYMAEMADSKVFGFLLDTYWVQAGGASPEKFIRDYHEYIDVVHLKDMKIVEDKETFAEVGEGNMDWDGIIRACKKADVKWYAIEQDICDGNPFDSLKISLDHIRSWDF